MTSLGIVELQRSPGLGDAVRPLVIGVTGLFAGAHDLAKLPEALGVYAEGVIVSLAQASRLATPSIEGMARALEEVIASTFPGRPIVLLGVSLGANACLAVRSPAVQRVVAVEPVLVAAKLWPILWQVRKRLASLPAEHRDHRFWGEMLGVGTEPEVLRDYRSLVVDRPAPTDVILGSEPLYPEREQKGFPSLVDAPERALLAAAPNVRLHVAASVGHNVQSKSRLVLDVLLEACRRAAAAHGSARLAVDEPLLEATPVTARRVAYLGPRGEAFRAAYLARNPQGQVTLLDPAELAGAAFDAIALAAAPTPPVLRALADMLAPDGQVVARWAPEAARGAALAPAGLVLKGGVDAAGTGVVRLAPAGSAAAASPALRLETMAFAPLLMDIRARLPAQQLGSLPDLAVRYHTKPFSWPELGRDTPKVTILQRPGDLNLDNWRVYMARMMAAGWIVVMEFDDHPRVIGEVHKGRARGGREDMERFAYFHAVQTSTPALEAAFREENPEVALFPNAVFELPPFPERPPPRRVFYGGVLRGEFAVSVAASLAPAIEAHPDVEFVVIGDKAVFEALPTDRKVLHPYMSYEAYLRVMSECAISLSPMEDRPLRETKSDAKFLDAARAGVLTIASPIIYDRVIRHGENGLLAPAVKDWSVQLRLALGDLDLQRRIARRAWEYVRDERMFADQLQARRDWYWSLWRRRDELYAGVLERVPGVREPYGEALAQRRAANRSG